jgi:hypothetical protein
VDNAPFFPVLTYQPARALQIAQRLNAAAMCFPAAAYRSFFPTATKREFVCPKAEPLDRLRCCAPAARKRGRCATAGSNSRFRAC